MHWALGRDPDTVSLVVVNNDINNCSMYDCHKLGCLTEAFSCCYTEDLGRKVEHFKFIYQTDFDSARELVVKNEAWGMIYFPNNFSSILEKRLDSYFNPRLSDKALESGQVQIYLDATDKIIEMFLKRKLVQIFVEFLGQRFEDCGWEKRAAQLPLKMEDPIYGNKDPIFTHYQTAPLIMNCCFFLPMMLTPMFLLDEKLSGFLQRSISSGLTAYELLAALVSVQLIVLSIQTIIFFVFLYGIYGHPFVTDIWLPLAICMFEGFSGICFGILISLVSGSYITASLGGNGMFFMITFTNGSLWPLEGVNPTLRKYFWYSPLASASDALRSMTVRGWTFQHPKVYPGFVSIVSWTIVYIVLALMIGFKKGIMVKK